MKVVELGEVCKIVNGGTPKTSIPEFWDGEINWITPADLGKLSTPIATNTSRKITLLGLEKSSAKLLPENSVILSTRAPIGHLAVNKVRLSTNQGCKGLVPGKKLNNWYLYYFLKNNVPLLESLGTGATFKELSAKRLAAVKIPLPPLPVQRRIAAILDAADEHRRKTEALIEQYDELAQSIFLEMFGDLIKNKKNLSHWCKVNPRKSEIAHIDKKTIVSFIPMSNVSEEGDLDLSLERPISEVWQGFTYFREGDVIFAKITPCMENGKGAIAYNLRNGIGFGSTEYHVFRPIPKISTSEWLYYLTSSKLFRQTAENYMTGSAGQKRVPTDFFGKFQVACPSYADQIKFKKIVDNLKQQKHNAVRSLNESETLFQSLLQRAFRGELVPEDEMVE